MFYTAREADLIISIISKKTGVRLINSGESWKANVKEKTIYYPKSAVLNDETLGFMIHEASHIRFTEPDNKYVQSCEEIAKKNNKYGQDLFKLINVSEDLRIERLTSDIYPGAKKILNNASIETNERMVENYKNFSKEKREKIKAFRSDNFCYALFMREYVSEKDVNKFLKYCDKETINIYNELKHYSKDIKNFDNFSEMVKFVIDNVIPKYLKLCSDVDENKEGKKEEENEGENEEDNTKDSSSSESSKGSEKKEENVDEGEGEDKNKNEKDKEEDEGDSDEDGKNGSDRGQEDEEDKEEKNEDGGVQNFTSIKRGGIEDIENDFEGFKNEGSINRSDVDSFFDIEDYGYFDYETFVKNSRMLLPKLKKPISILKDLEFKRDVTGFESGKIDMRRINKLFVGYTRVFKRASAESLDDKDLAIAVLVDESGSMNSFGKDIVATTACGAISLALEQAGKKFAVFGFNRKFHIHKEFKKKVYMPNLYKIYKNVYTDDAGYNNDGYAIKRTIKELNKMPEKNKILIVLSDGEPASSFDSSDEGIPYSRYILTDEIKRAESRAKVYSIGILSEAVRRYYNPKTTFVIREVNELPKYMFEILKKTVGKRIR